MEKWCFSILSREENSFLIVSTNFCKFLMPLNQIHKEEKLDICRIQRNEVKMKGGRILAYEITVLLGSIPFVIFLTWQARAFGLTRRGALLIAICLCGDVMLFNWAFRSGWIILWLLSIVFFFILGLLLSKVQKSKSKDNALASKIDVYTENRSKDEIISQRHVTALSTESIEMLEEFRELTPVAEPSKMLKGSTSIDELIEQGFIEKYSENFEQATYFFIKALSLDPIPDLAFYLIIDCYWLWNNLGKRDYALTQLQAYILNYLPQFNPELRHQFDAWMTEENIHYEK